MSEIDLLTLTKTVWTGVSKEKRTEGSDLFFMDNVYLFIYKTLRK